jgi:hypothetical protein
VRHKSCDIRYIGQAFCMAAKLRTAQSLVAVDMLNNAKSSSRDFIPDLHEGQFSCSNNPEGLWRSPSIIYIEYWVHLTGNKFSGS